MAWAYETKLRRQYHYIAKLRIAAATAAISYQSVSYRHELHLGWTALKAHAAEMARQKRKVESKLDLQVSSNTVSAHPKQE